MEFYSEYKNRISEIDLYIENYISCIDGVEPVLTDGMKYAVLNGGKRLRSILCTELCKAFSGSNIEAFPYAAAIEFIHAYSLVHDDLPAMDNADSRRGLPSCHKKFGEDIAILIGDALLNNAFEIMLEKSTGTEKDIRAMKTVASSAGIYGMVNGQVRDLNLSTSENATESEVTKMIEQKTMALIRGAAVSGAIIAGCNEEQVAIVDKFAYHLGLAFQIRDDFEDFEEDQADEHSCPNFINILGYENAKKKLELNCIQMIKYLDRIENNSFLKKLCEFLFPEYIK